MSHDPNLHRLLLLTDAVYAIALTLLALDLRLPAEAGHVGGAALLASLFAMGPKLLGYATSFTVVGLFWSLHHRTLRFVERCDGAFVWLTLLHLACISFLPFPTAVIGEHLGDQIAEEFYFGCLAITTLVSAANWWYATGNRRLVAPELDGEIIHAYRILAGLAAGGLIALMILVALGLGRVIEPLVLGYVFTIVFIIEGIRDWSGQKRGRWRATSASVEPTKEINGRE